MTLKSPTTFKEDVCILIRAQMWFHQARTRVEIDVKRMLTWLIMLRNHWC